MVYIFIFQIIAASYGDGDFILVQKLVQISKEKYKIRFLCPKAVLQIGIKSEGGIRRLLDLCGRWTNLKLTDADQKTIRHQLDSYCRKVLHDESCTIKKQFARRGE